MTKNKKSRAYQDGQYFATMMINGGGIDSDKICDTCKLPMKRVDSLHYVASIYYCPRCTLTPKSEV